MSDSLRRFIRMHFQCNSQDVRLVTSRLAKSNTYPLHVRLYLCVHTYRKVHTFIPNQYCSTPMKGVGCSQGEIDFNHGLAMHIRGDCTSYNIYQSTRAYVVDLNIVCR